MTSPSCPVSTSAPFPSPSSTLVVSMYKVEPPIAVQAKPMTTPTGVCSYIRSAWNTGFPTKSPRFDESTNTFSIALSAGSSFAPSVSLLPLDTLASLDASVGCTS
uniref:LON2 n=1 Tax=Arundo donax TaxID=35708 RepID=A0A0A9CNJ2_ARUDO